MSASTGVLTVPTCPRLYFPLAGLKRQRLDVPYVKGAAGLAPATWQNALAAVAAAVAQVRFCRYRFPPTDELKYRGARRVRTQCPTVEALPYCY